MTFRITIVGLTAFLLGGCFAKPPVVDNAGNVRGGDERLRTLLLALQEDCRERKAADIVRYTVFMDPGGFPAALEGSSPAVGDLRAFEYTIVHSAATIDHVTQAVVVREAATGSNTTYELWGYCWDGQAWCYITVPVISVSDGTREPPAPVSPTSSPTP